MSTLDMGCSLQLDGRARAAEAKPAEDPGALLGRGMGGGARKGGGRRLGRGLQVIRCFSPRSPLFVFDIYISSFFCGAREGLRRPYLARRFVDKFQLRGDKLDPRLRVDALRLEAADDSLVSVVLRVELLLASSGPDRVLELHETPDPDCIVVDANDARAEDGEVLSSQRFPADRAARIVIVLIPEAGVIALVAKEQPEAFEPGAQLLEP